MAKFDTYAELLVDWQQRMNLVGPATLASIWTRHFDDSAQLHKMVPPGSVIDLGSGAGFPGLVLALLGARPVVLIEATTKKCQFLEAVVDALELSGVTIHNARIEALQLPSARMITARACANLTRLFGWGSRFMGPQTEWLLLKGETVGDEIAEARRQFAFDVELIPSSSDPRGRIVAARNVRRIAGPF